MKHSGLLVAALAMTMGRMAEPQEQSYRLGRYKSVLSRDEQLARKRRNNASKQSRKSQRRKS